MHRAAGRSKIRSPPSHTAAASHRPSGAKARSVAGTPHLKCKAVLLGRNKGIPTNNTGITTSSKKLSSRKSTTRVGSGLRARTSLPLFCKLCSTAMCLAAVDRQVSYPVGYIRPQGDTTAHHPLCQITSWKYLGLGCKLSCL